VRRFTLGERVQSGRHAAELCGNRHESLARRVGFAASGIGQRLGIPVPDSKEADRRRRCRKAKLVSAGSGARCSCELRQVFAVVYFCLKRRMLVVPGDIQREEQGRPTSGSTPVPVSAPAYQSEPQAFEQAL